MNKYDLKGGQKLWLVRSRHGRQKDYAGEEIQIFRTGRDWAYFGPAGQERIRLDSLRIDGEGDSRAYLSREAFDVERETDKAWEALHFAVRARYRRPDGVTAADIDQATKLLRLLPSA